MAHDTQTIVKLDEALCEIEAGHADSAGVMRAMAYKQQLYETYRAMSFRFEMAAIDWIETNGEIEDGDKRYYVGTDTERKCLNAPVAFEAMLSAAGGDMDSVLRVLSSQPFKPAAACELLADKANEHFETTVQKDLKTGKPRKKLASTQTNQPKGVTQ